LRVKKIEQCVIFVADTRFPVSKTAGAKPECELARLYSFKLSNIVFYMNVQEQINKYLASQPEPKRTDMLALHQLALKVLPGCILWFLDGKNNEGKVVSNPNAGYGSYTMEYANGTTREFYQIGLSANQTGISVYIMGIKDKIYLAQTFGKKLGKASVTGYCIKFKMLKDINIDVLEAAMRYGVEQAEVQGR
jgi:Domain of unknown function (DU1801)